MLQQRKARHWTLAKAQAKATEFFTEIETQGINPEYV